jgi:uncharacterized protein with ParB-like and HNH nuclease domain
MAASSSTQIQTYLPEKRTIGELLSTTNPHIVVPDWQRSYSWTTSHVETFWNDLVDFEKRNPGTTGREYFLGSVVIVATSERSNLLLDGQQRIATSAILLSVIRDKIREYNEDAAKRLQARFLADIDDARGGELLYKLALNTYDAEFFRRKILEYRAPNYKEPAPTHASHNLINDARNFFEDEVEKGYAKLKTPKESYEWALRIQNTLLNRMSVVAVSSTDEDSAAEVFETLNDRGIGLSTPDLLRNFVMRRAPEGQRTEIVALWGDVIEFDTDTEIRTFLRHFWISHQGDIKTQRLYREIKDSILAANIDSLKFSRDLKDASIIYKDILEARDNDPSIEYSLKSIAELGATILYPVVLSVMEVVPAEKRPAILNALVTTYVRHSVIGQLENSKLENVIYRIATDLRAEKPPEDAIKELSAFAPSDDDFRRSFERVTISRAATQRYLLRELELDLRTTAELTISPPHKVHVEHIYPQNPEMGQAAANHEQIVNRLGNLTLLDRSLNTSIKNGAFDKKLPSYGKSELLLTRALIEQKSWDADKITERQRIMADQALKVWSLPQS